MTYFTSLQRSLFIFLLLAATVLFGWLISSYFMSLLWAVVLAILFYPLYLRILSFVRGRASIASLLTITSILVVVIVPIYLLGTMVANEAVTLYMNLSQSNISSFSYTDTLKSLMQPLQDMGFNTAPLIDSIVSFAQSASAQIGTYAIDIGRATFNTIIGIALMLYILFFTFRDGAHIGRRVMDALPLGDEKEQLLFNRFASIVYAMFKGTFIIALIQGLIGGILFVSVGIQSAVLWAVIMGVFALIPAIGPAIVWLPAGILLIVMGQTWQGAIVLIVGALILSTIDNVLRPLLISKGVAMSDVMILLSVLGGLSLFGVAGIIIGPVIAAFFLSMWQLFERDYAKELQQRG